MLGKPPPKKGSWMLAVYLGELLLCLELVLQQGVLLLQGRHQGGLNVFVLLQGHEGSVKLADLHTWDIQGL